MEHGNWVNLKSATSSFMSQDGDIEILREDSSSTPSARTPSSTPSITASIPFDKMTITPRSPSAEACNLDESYLKVFSDDVPDLEQIIDTETPEQILEIQRFDQWQVLLRLVKTAQTINIRPDQLYADIKTLIQAETQYAAQETIGDTIKTMLALKKKYCVEENAMSGDSVTMFRLRIMFPQYSCPLAEESLLHRVTSFIFERIGPETCSNKDACPIFSNLRAVRSIMAIPAGMKTLEFASAIPTNAVELLTEANRRYLIVAHLAYQILLNYYIKCDTPLKKIPPPTPKVFNPTLVKTKVQIANGLLSDKQRLYFLQDMGWVKLNGDVDEVLRTAVASFKDDFSEAYKQIRYKVFAEDPDTDEQVLEGEPSGNSAEAELTTGEPAKQSSSTP